MSEAFDEEKLTYSPGTTRTASPPMRHSDPQEDTWDTTVTPAGQIENSLGGILLEILRLQKQHIGVQWGILLPPLQARQRTL